MECSGLESKLAPSSASGSSWSVRYKVKLGGPGEGQALQGFDGNCVRLAPGRRFKISEVFNLLQAQQHHIGIAALACTNSGIISQSQSR